MAAYELAPLFLDRLLVMVPWLRKKCRLEILKRHYLRARSLHDINRALKIKLTERTLQRIMKYLRDQAQAGAFNALREEMDDAVYELALDAWREHQRSYRRTIPGLGWKK